MDRAFQIEPNPYIKIFKYVVHDHKESFVFFLLCVFPNYLVKTKESWNQCLRVSFDMVVILFEYLLELYELSFWDLLY